MDPLTLAIISKTAPVVLPVAATMFKAFGVGDDKLLSALADLGLNIAAGSSSAAIEKILCEQPDIAAHITNEHLMRHTGHVIGALISRYIENGARKEYHADLKKLAKAAPDAWLEFVRAGCDGLEVVRDDEFLNRLASALATKEADPALMAFPIATFITWLCGRNKLMLHTHADAVGGLRQWLKEHLSHALLSTLVAEHPASIAAYKDTMLRGLTDVRQRLDRMEKKQDWTAGAVAGLHLKTDVVAATVADIRANLATSSSQRTGILHLSPDSAHTVPVPTKHFTGRKKELGDLHRILFGGDHTGIITGVHGLGGMGKTELAYAYARDFAAEYPGGRFIIECDQRTSLRDAALGTASFTALFVPHVSEAERMVPASFFAAIVTCLQQRIASHGPVLIVLDNVSAESLLISDETRALSALGSGLHLLATTRLAPPDGDHAHWLPLDRLTEEDAVGLLEEHRAFKTEDERATARRLVQRLGCWALAVEIIAAHLRAHPAVKIEGLADTIGLAELEHEKVQQSAKAIRHHQERLLTSIMNFSLEKLSPEQRRTLDYAALLAPDHVPLPWLHSLVTTDFPDLAKPDSISDPWDDCWRGLVHLALFTRADGEGDPPRLLRIHRLVQEHLQKQMGEGERQVRQGGIERLVRERDGVLDTTTQWQQARWEIEPLEALAGLWADAGHEFAAWLMNQMGQCLHDLAEYTRAEPLMRRALAIDEASYGAEHPNVAIRLNNLATLLQDTNRLAEAEPLMRRALAIDEASYGAEHPQVAIRLNNLATLLQDTNRLAEAEPLMRRALAIDEASYGAEHPDVAIDLNNLASLLQDTNRLAEAEPLMRRALAIDEASYGAEHPQVAIDLNNLATLLQATNRLAEAEPLMRRALAIDEASYGAEHPKVAIRLNNLAQLLQATNRLAEAEPLMRRALAIDEASYGAEHPQVARDLNNLAQLLKATNRLAEAEPLMRRALAIDEASYGAEHPKVAIRLNNLAALLQATNRLAEAEPLMRRALAIDEASYDAEHPLVAIRLNNLAALLQATNRLAEAEPLMRRALAIDEASYGAEHPEVATDLNNLAQLLKATNRMAEAEPLMRRVVSIFEQSLGAEHPHVASALNNLAQLLQATNRLAEAEPLMERVASIFEQSVGPNHPNVATALNNLAQLLQATNRLAEAEPLMRRVVSIFEQSLGAKHPNVASALNNLAQLLQATNRLAEAEPLMRRALAIDEASYGAEHPEVARDLNNLASLLKATNRLAEAEPLMRRALEIDEASYGAEHPEVARDLNNLALLLQATNRLAEAEPLMRRVVGIFLDFTRRTGHPHPHLQAAFGNYAGLLHAMGRTKEEILAELKKLAPAIFK